MTSQDLTTAAEYAPIIERVHGANHPELTRVREITEQLPNAADIVHEFPPQLGVNGDASHNLIFHTLHLYRIRSAGTCPRRRIE